MSQERNYYDILGVSKDASEQDIKKAYRRLSLQYHPDRNADPDAETMFKEINAAHETLSDAGKRQQYDMEQEGGGGFPFFAGGGPPGAEFHDINNIFRQFFGGGGMPGGVSFAMGPGMGHGHEFHFFPGGGPPGFFQQQMMKPPAIIKNLTLTLEQAYFGGNFPIQVEVWNQSQNMRTVQNHTINVSIPPGIDENEVVILRESGNSVEGGPKGDIKIVIQIVNSTIFQRQGLDLVCNHTITLKEALCGFKYEIRHLNNKTLAFNNLTNVTVIKPGYKKVIPNLGMNKGGQTGNLIIQFEVAFPDSLGAEQIQKLAEIL